MSLDTHAHANPHHEHPDVVGSRNRLGVILLLVADIAFALSMVFVYFYLKAQNVNDMWLPAATEDDPAIVAVSSSAAWRITAIAAVGLIAHFIALRNVRKGNQSGLKTFGLLAFVISAVALVVQLQQFGAVSFTFWDGGYVSCWYMFAIMNTVHLALTAFISLGNWNRSRLGLYKADHWQVDIVNVWWIWMVVSSLLGAFSLSYT
ncbi:MAG: cytochrome c oxidase subunit 3 [Candidatus Planktophila sp.]|jgi:heme/copper-type cytochrome/quinol oxidase subunit 3|tara:strand:- start:4814 stop:5428 length:615 start_codon:yes stop_codon:yes gene_type:complete